MNSELRFLRVNNPIFWGTVATLVVVITAMALALRPACVDGVFQASDCPSKFRAFLDSSPNEVGDTLAGFAGALAFIWLIATVWLQSQELAEQRQELREQRIATQEMAKAQEKQVGILAQQGAIFEDEQKQRNEARAHDLLVQRMNRIRDLFSDQSDTVVANLVYPNGDMKRTHFALGTTQKTDEDLSQYFVRLFQNLSQTSTHIDVQKQQGVGLSGHLISHSEADELLTLIQRVLCEVDNLSAADAQWVSNCRLEGILTAVKTISGKDGEK